MPDTAPDLVAAPEIDPLTVPCPAPYWCNAPAGERCKAWSDWGGPQRPARQPHKARVKAALLGKETTDA